jgi:DNA-binding response OmpR family regulator
MFEGVDHQLRHDEAQAHGHVGLRHAFVDDDIDLREALAEQLELGGEFVIAQAGAGAAGVALAQERRPDLVLLDVDLPDFDGREVARRMRVAGVVAPIIMLTGQTSDADTIAGLEAGANDYVSKPFKFAVLMARIRAQLRSHEQSEDAVFRLGPYEFRPAAKLLLDEKNKKIRLTEKEASILKYLYRAGEKPVAAASEKFSETVNVPELSCNWCSSYNVEPSFTPGSASQMARASAHELARMITMPPERFPSSEFSAPPMNFWPSRSIFA